MTEADRSIHHLAKSLGSQTSLFRDRDPAVSEETLRSVLIQDVAADYVLILDNWDAIGGSESETFIGEMVAKDEFRIHLYLACRRPAKLPTAKLLEAGRLRLIGKEALKFSDSEQRRLIGEKEWLGLSHSALAAFDGWPLAFSLLNASEQAADRVLQEPSVFARQSGLEDIIVAELNHTCRRDELRILDVLGIGTDLDLATIQHVSGVNDAGRSFDAVANLIPCRPYADGATLRYGFTPLLGPLLERRFDRLKATERRSILRKAYERSIGQGRTLEAINFALLEGKADRAVELMEAIGPLMLILIYGIEPVEGLLRRIPLDLYARAFRSRLTVPVIQAKRGYLAEAREMVESVVDDIIASELPEISKRQAMRDATFARIQIAAVSEKEWTGEFEQGALGELAKEPAFAAWVRICSGLAHQQAGRLRAADDDFHQSEVASRQFGAAYQLIHLRLHRALVELTRGRIRSARRAFRALSVEARSSYPNDLSLLAAIEAASLETSLLSSRPSVQLDTLLAVVVKLRQSDGLYDLFAIAFANTARVLYVGDPGALFVWLKETEAEFVNVGVTHIVGILRAIRAFYAAIGGRFDITEQALPRGEFVLSEEITRVSWRERHLEGMARSIVASHLGDHDRASEIAAQLVLESRRDGRQVALVEACLTHAGALLRGARDTDEALNVLAFALNTAEEMGAPGILDEWGSLIEDHARSVSSRLRPSAARMIDHLVRRWRDQVRPDVLSARETEVLSCIATGMTNKLAAHKLMIGVDAVKFHLKRIFLKLNVHGRDEAVARAKAAGLI